MLSDALLNVPSRQRGAGNWSRRPHGPRGRAGYGTAFEVLALFALGIVGLGYVLLVVKVLLRIPPELFTDWQTFHRAATELRTGAGAQLYQEGLRLIESNSYEYWRESNMSGHGQYIYPPLFAFLLIPLSWLSVLISGIIWLALLTLAVGGFIWTMLRVLRRPISLATVAIIAVPVLAGAREGPISGIQYGQPDIILLLLLTLSLLAYRRRRAGLAGVVLGLAACVKPTLALVGLFYFRKRQWTTLGTATVTGLGVGVVPLLLLGQAALADWLAIGDYFATGDVAVYSANMSLRALLLRAFYGGPFNAPLFANRTLADLLWLLASAAIMWLWWRSVSPTPGRTRLAVAEYGLTLAVILFVAPFSEYNHYTAVLLPLAFLADRAAWAPPSRRWLVLAVAACLYYAQPWLLQGNVAPGLDNTLRLLASTSFLYGLVPVGLSLVLLLRHERQRRRHPRSAPAIAEPQPQNLAAS